MNYGALLASLLFALSAGWIGSLFTFDATTTWYPTLVKSSLNPPNYVFGPVWTVLYVMMGCASYFVWTKIKEGTLATIGLGLYVAQLSTNALWSIVFFGLQSPEIAFVVMLVLIVLVGACAAVFYRVRKVAGLLLVPYLVWLFFAAYLNLFIVLNN